MITALALSGGKDSIACLHLMRDSIDFALYVDTGFSYPETAAMIDYARDFIPVITVHSDRENQNKRFGLPSDIVPIDWTVLGQQITGEKPALIQSYLGCCYENISVPLYDKAVELGVDELIYGQRNDEGHKSPARNGDMIGNIRRLNPIETWSASDVLNYLETKMAVPEHFHIKHSSLDCYDCTAFRKDSKDRIAWTKEHYPAYFVEFSVRAKMIDAALLEAM